MGARIRLKELLEAGFLISALTQSASFTARIQALHDKVYALRREIHDLSLGGDTIKDLAFERAELVRLNPYGFTVAAVLGSAGGANT